MYHRFDENKYPSTNIKNEIFLKHLDEISRSRIEFISLEKFEKIIKTNLDKIYILLTIDDAFESFYKNAWPILKKRKFHLYFLYLLEKLATADIWTGIKL